ncbi:hypothetical protein [Catenulispora sp. GP43]|uniref:hypothetical protein n=1 Tax=Catenulispora sp. GP43 TaxID=3156263 RepID=UPI003512CE6C
MEADWLAACAVSVHPLMRRVAAIISVALPPDLVDRAAHDPAAAANPALSVERLHDLLNRAAIPGPAPQTC